MSTVRPFMAVRPAKGLESEIAALPYDVFNRAEAKEYVSDKPLSFLRIDRAETQLDDSVSTYDESVYKKAKELYKEMLDKKQFVKDEKPSLYLYEQIMDGRSQTGLVCTASVYEYENNIILKHENTRAEKEVDRINHVDTLSAQTGPIFLAYRDDKSMSDVFKKIKAAGPYAEFKDHGVTQRLFEINDDKDIEFIVNAFKNIKNLYIADGHHRCASACKVSKLRRGDADATDTTKEYNFFLSVVFPDSELMIMDYNRVVKDLNGYDKDSFIEKIKERFNVAERTNDLNKPEKKGDIYMYLDDKCYVISLKNEYLKKDPIGVLDVSVLQENLLGPILNITDPKTDSRIDFVGGIRGIEGLKDRLSKDARIAFAMYPTSLSELFDVADAGLLMPPKSTWFEPKLLSGLFIHEI